MSGTIWVQESYINRTEHYGFGDSDVYETYTDDRGKLFKDMQKEYGRCISKVYVDGPRAKDPLRDSQPIQVGWVFEKRMEYEDARADWPDSRRFYMREVWITLHTAPPVMTTRYNYLYPRSTRPVHAS